MGIKFELKIMEDLYVLDGVLSTVARASPHGIDFSCCFPPTVGVPPRWWGAVGAVIRGGKLLN